MCGALSVDILRWPLWRHGASPGLRQVTTTMWHTIATTTWRDQMPPPAAVGASWRETSSCSLERTHGSVGMSRGQHLFVLDRSGLFVCFSRRAALALEQRSSQRGKQQCSQGCCNPASNGAYIRPAAAVWSRSCSTAVAGTSVWADATAVGVARGGSDWAAAGFERRSCARSHLRWSRFRSAVGTTERPSHAHVHFLHSVEAGAKIKAGFVKTLVNAPSHGLLRMRDK